jgi:hypothetical protein
VAHLAAADAQLTVLSAYEACKTSREVL